MNQFKFASASARFVITNKILWEPFKSVNINKTIKHTRLFECL